MNQLNGRLQSIQESEQEYTDLYGTMHRLSIQGSQHPQQSQQQEDSSIGKILSSKNLNSMQLQSSLYLKTLQENSILNKFSLKSQQSSQLQQSNYLSPGSQFQSLQQNSARLTLPNTLEDHMTIQNGGTSKHFFDENSIDLSFLNYLNKEEGLNGQGGFGSISKGTFGSKNYPLSAFQSNGQLSSIQNLNTSNITQFPSTNNVGKSSHQIEDKYQQGIQNINDLVKLLASPTTFPTVTPDRTVQNKQVAVVATSTAAVETVDNNPLQSKQPNPSKPINQQYEEIMAKYQSILQNSNHEKPDEVKQQDQYSPDLGHNDSVKINDYSDNMIPILDSQSHSHIGMQGLNAPSDPYTPGPNLEHRRLSSLDFLSLKPNTISNNANMVVEKREYSPSLRQITFDQQGDLLGQINNHPNSYINQTNSMNKFSVTNSAQPISQTINNNNNNQNKNHLINDLNGQNKTLENNNSLQYAYSQSNPNQINTLNNNNNNEIKYNTISKLTTLLEDDKVKRALNNNVQPNNLNLAPVGQVDMNSYQGQQLQQQQTSANTSLTHQYSYSTVNNNNNYNNTNNNNFNNGNLNLTNQPSSQNNTNQLTSNQTLTQNNTNFNPTAQNYIPPNFITPSLKSKQFDQIVSKYLPTSRSTQGATNQNQGYFNAHNSQVSQSNSVASSMLGGQHNQSYESKSIRERSNSKGNNNVATARELLDNFSTGKQQNDTQNSPQHRQPLGLLQNSMTNSFHTDRLNTLQSAQKLKDSNAFQQQFQPRESNAFQSNQPLQLKDSNAFQQLQMKDSNAFQGNNNTYQYDYNSKHSINTQNLLTHTTNNDDVPHYVNQKPVVQQNENALLKNSNYNNLISSLQENKYQPYFQGGQQPNANVVSSSVPQKSQTDYFTSQQYQQPKALSRNPSTEKHQFATQYQPSSAFSQMGQQQGYLSQQNQLPTNVQQNALNQLAPSQIALSTPGYSVSNSVLNNYPNTNFSNNQQFTRTNNHMGSVVAAQSVQSNAANSNQNSRKVSMESINRQNQFAQNPTTLLPVQPMQEKHAILDAKTLLQQIKTDNFSSIPPQSANVQQQALQQQPQQQFQSLMPQTQLPSQQSSYAPQSYGFQQQPQANLQSVQLQSINLPQFQNQITQQQQQYQAGQTQQPQNYMNQQNQQFQQNNMLPQYLNQQQQPNQRRPLSQQSERPTIYTGVGGGNRDILPIALSPISTPSRGEHMQFQNNLEKDFDLDFSEFVQDLQTQQQYQTRSKERDNVKRTMKPSQSQPYLQTLNFGQNQFQTESKSRDSSENHMSKSQSKPKRKIFENKSVNQQFFTAQKPKTLKMNQQMLKNVLSFNKPQTPSQSNNNNYGGMERAFTEQNLSNQGTDTQSTKEFGVGNNNFNANYNPYEGMANINKATASNSFLPPRPKYVVPPKDESPIKSYFKDPPKNLNDQRGTDRDMARSTQNQVREQQQLQSQQQSTNRYQFYQAAGNDYKSESSKKDFNIFDQPSLVTPFRLTDRNQNSRPSASISNNNENQYLSVSTAAKNFVPFQQKQRDDAKDMIRTIKSDEELDENVKRAQFSKSKSTAKIFGNQNNADAPHRQSIQVTTVSPLSSQPSQTTIEAPRNPIMANPQSSRPTNTQQVNRNPNYPVITENDRKALAQVEKRMFQDQSQLAIPILCINCDHYYEQREIENHICIPSASPSQAQQQKGTSEEDKTKKSKRVNTQQQKESEQQQLAIDESLINDKIRVIYDKINEQPQSNEQQQIKQLVERVLKLNLNQEGLIKECRNLSHLNKTVENIKSRAGLSLLILSQRAEVLLKDKIDVITKKEAMQNNYVNNNTFNINQTSSFNQIDQQQQAGKYGPASTRTNIFRNTNASANNVNNQYENFPSEYDVAEVNFTQNNKTDRAEKDRLTAVNPPSMNIYSSSSRIPTNNSPRAQTVYSNQKNLETPQSQANITNNQHSNSKMKIFQPPVNTNPFTTNTNTYANVNPNAQANKNYTEQVQFDSISNFSKKQQQQKYAFNHNNNNTDDATSQYSSSAFSIESKDLLKKYQQSNGLIKFNESTVQSQQKRMFYNIALNLKLKLPTNHPARDCIISEMFTQAEKQNVAEGNYQKYIENYFKQFKC